MAAAVAAGVGISHFRSAMLPADKLAFVQAEQAQSGAAAAAAAAKAEAKAAGEAQRRRITILGQLQPCAVYGTPHALNLLGPNEPCCVHPISSICPLPILPCPAPQAGAVAAVALTQPPAPRPPPLPSAPPLPPAPAPLAARADTC